MIHRPEGDSQKILRFLTKLPLFEAVDKFSILKLVNKMTLKRVRAKEIVFNQGDFVDHVYFIVQGKCKLTTRYVRYEVACLKNMLCKLL